MRKLVIVISALVMFSFVSATCNLDVTMINQDPYPAVPGDYVKLVFQVTGVDNPECSQVSIELLDKYPISFDPGVSHIVQAKGGVYDREFSSYLIAPYKVRLDENALDGENNVEVRYGTGEINSSYTLKSFNIEVDDTHADFEIYIKDYDAATKTITFEILNIAETDVEALTIEIPRQENIEIQGAKTNVVGNIDSNEYTTADFTAMPRDGEIKLIISYSDSINVRRTLEKTVVFEPEYFTQTVEKGTAWYMYLIYVLIFAAISYYFYRRQKKKREHRRNLHRRGSARLG